LTTSNNNSEYTRFNLNAGDYNFLRSQVASINWEGMVNTTMEETWDYFFTQFDTAIKNSIPSTSSQLKFRNIYSNREVLRLRKKKRILWKQYLNTRCSLDHDRFARVRNELCSMTRNLKSNYLDNLASNIKSSPKAFWKYVNFKMKTRLPVDTLKTSDNGEAISNLMLSINIVQAFSPRKI